MALLALAPPTFVDGNLLSAAQLNILTECTNALQGASISPSGIFYRTGNNNTWWARRKWDYVHVFYVTSGTSCTTKIYIDGIEMHSDSTLRPSGYIASISLQDAGVSVDDFYNTEVRYAAVSASHDTQIIWETNSSDPAWISSYVSPHSWGNSDTPTAEQLNTIGAAIDALSIMLDAPSATLYRVSDSTTYTMRRRQQYLNVVYNASGSASVRVLINGTSVYQSAAIGDGITKQIDLSAVSGGPSVGEFYSVEFRRQDGSVYLMDLYESGSTPSTYAVTFAHGDTLPNATNLNKYKTVLDSVYAILYDVPWHFPATYRTVDHPQWTIRKTKRYLHYVRAGSRSATLEDPGGVYETLTLSTDRSTGYGSLDLDTVDWLAPGGKFTVHEADTVWLDDKA